MTTAAKVTTPITSKDVGSVGSKRHYAGNDGEQPAGLVVAAAAGALWWRWTALTTEHDPTKLPLERQRVEAAFEGVPLSFGVPMMDASGT